MDRFLNGYFQQVCFSSLLALCWIMVIFSPVYGQKKLDRVPVIVLPSAKNAALQQPVRQAQFTTPNRSNTSNGLPATHSSRIAKPKEAIQPMQPIPLSLPPQLPQSEFRLQSDSPRHNLKASGLLPPVETIPAPATTQQPTQMLPTGDTIMTFSIRKTLLAAVLGTGLIAGSSYADGEPPANNNDTITKKDLDTTNNLLTELKKQLTDLKTKEFAELSAKIDALKTKELQALKSDIEQLKTAKKQTLETLEGTDQGDGLLKRMTTMENRLKALSNQIDQLDRKLDSTRTSLSSPLANQGANRLAKSGTVKLLNLYATDVDILVNGVAYRVSPNETRTLSLAPGSFTYQLLTGGGQEVSRTIKESEEVLLKVN